MNSRFQNWRMAMMKCFILLNQCSIIFRRLEEKSLKIKKTWLIQRCLLSAYFNSKNKLTIWSKLVSLMTWNFREQAISHSKNLWALSQEHHILWLCSLIKNSKMKDSKPQIKISRSSSRNLFVFSAVCFKRIPSSHPTQTSWLKDFWKRKVQPTKNQSSTW